MLAIPNFISVSIRGTEGQQLVNQWMRPHYWYVMYGDARTCDDQLQEDYTIGYTLYFLNPDSYGNANDHFGEDQKGITCSTCTSFMKRA